MARSSRLSTTAAEPSPGRVPSADLSNGRIFAGGREGADAVGDQNAAHITCHVHGPDQHGVGFVSLKQTRANVKGAEARGGIGGNRKSWERPCRIPAQPGLRQRRPGPQGSGKRSGPGQNHLSGISAKRLFGCHPGKAGLFQPVCMHIAEAPSNMVIRCLHVKAHADDSPHAGPKLSGRVSGIGHCPLGNFQHEKVLSRISGFHWEEYANPLSSSVISSMLSAGKIGKSRRAPAIASQPSSGVQGAFEYRICRTGPLPGRPLKFESFQNRHPCRQWRYPEAGGGAGRVLWGKAEAAGGKISGAHSSRRTWPLMPPNPKALIAARRGMRGSLRCQGSARVCT